MSVYDETRSCSAGAGVISGIGDAITISVAGFRFANLTIDHTLILFGSKPIAFVAFVALGSIDV